MIIQKQWKSFGKILKLCKKRLKIIINIIEEVIIYFETESSLTGKVK